MDGRQLANRVTEWIAVAIKFFVAEHHRITESIHIDTEHNHTNNYDDSNSHRYTADGSGLLIAIWQQLLDFDGRLDAEAVQGNRL